MAPYNPNELVSSFSKDRPPRMFPEHTLPKTFVTGPAGTVMPKGTPVARDNSLAKWIVWDFTNVVNQGYLIRGFLAQETDLNSAAPGEVLAQVMTEGEIHFDDIPLPAGQTVADLKTACRILKTENIRVQGLADFV